jgi:hypothetical protein
MSEKSADEFDRYLFRQMEAQELAAFEERLLNEPGLMEELQVRTDLIIGIRVAEHRAIKKRLSKLNSWRNISLWWARLIQIIRKFTLSK